MGHSTVMLSTFASLSVNSAKHLAAQRERPFAALRVTVERPSRQLSRVGFFGQIVTFVGAGEGRSGVGTLASPMGGRGEAAGEQDTGRRKRPHPSSLSLPPLRDYETARFTNYLPLRGGSDEVGTAPLGSAASALPAVRLRAIAKPMSKTNPATLSQANRSP